MKVLFESEFAVTRSDWYIMLLEDKQQDKFGVVISHHLSYVFHYFIINKSGKLYELECVLLVV